MPAMFPSQRWRWTQVILVACVGIFLLLQPQKLEPPRRIIQPVIAPFTLMSVAPAPLFAINDNFDELLVAAPTTRPATAPFLRGLYTGAARTAVDSSGKSHIVWMEVTAYCPCSICCGPRAVGITSSGYPITYNDGAFVAADRFPFGTRLRVPGYHDGAIVEVQDRGSAILGPRLDVFFPTHDQAAAWGRQWLPITLEGD